MLLLIPPNIRSSACVCADYARRVQSLGSPEGLNSESKTSVADGLTFRTDVSSSMYPTNPDCACSNGFHPSIQYTWTGRRQIIHSEVTAVLKGQRLVQSPETQGRLLDHSPPVAKQFIHTNGEPASSSHDGKGEETVVVYPHVFILMTLSVSQKGKASLSIHGSPAVCSLVMHTRSCLCLSHYSGEAVRTRRAADGSRVARLGEFSHPIWQP